jgi:hypothetical protein
MSLQVREGECTYAPRSETRVGAEVVFGHTFRSERRAGVGSERCSSLVRPSGRTGGLESEAGAVPPWPGLLVGDYIALPAYRLGIWAGLGVARRSQCYLLGRAFIGKPVHKGPRVYEPNGD